MRIITGIAKGKKLKTPDGLDTRPTADRVKQSLFNILSTHVLDSTVLDMFAGTGNLGLEAVSQGATSCTFLENDRKAFSILSQNITSVGFDKQSEKLQGDAFEHVIMLGKKGRKFDLVFLDPPYSKGLIEKSIDLIDKNSLLTENGLIVSEYDEEDVIPEQVGRIHIYRTVKYGRTKISFWRMGVSV